jgi:hypothetical protein
MLMFFEKKKCIIFAILNTLNFFSRFFSALNVIVSETILQLFDANHIVAFVASVEEIVIVSRLGTEIFVTEIFPLNIVLVKLVVTSMFCVFVSKVSISVSVSTFSELNVNVSETTLQVFDDNYIVEFVASVSKIAIV